jgi:hypothetical protein
MVMVQLKHSEAQLLSSVLGDRFNKARKFRVGDLPVGSIIISRTIHEFDGVPEYAILVTFRKNKEDTRCASLEGYDGPRVYGYETDYVLKNDEEVVHLINCGNDNE